MRAAKLAKLAHLLRPAAVLAFTMLFTSACEKSVTYSYFAITVTLDRNSIDEQLLEKINSCVVMIDTETQDNWDASGIPCIKGHVPYDLGRIEYSSTITKGSLRFVFIMKNLGDEVIAKGATPFLVAKPEGTTSASVVVKSLAVFDKEKPSPMDGGAGDSRADASLAPDGSVH